MNELRGEKRHTRDEARRGEMGSLSVQPTQSEVDRRDPEDQEYEYVLGASQVSVVVMVGRWRCPDV